MKYKATNSELEETLEGIKTIMNEKITLPVTVIYKIIKNKLAIENALLAFHMTRDKIVDRYSGGKGIITKDDPDAFDKAFFEIMRISKEQTEIDILGISLSELNEKAMPFNILSAIGFMIEE